MIWEIFVGYDFVVIMCLDCDEDVELVRLFWEIYCEFEVLLFFVLYVMVFIDFKYYKLLFDVLGSGGLIFFYMFIYVFNWGGSYEVVLYEGVELRVVIEWVIGYFVWYVVLLFYYILEYVRKVFVDVGYEGCVGGIINCDFDFMIVCLGVLVG